MPSTVPCTFCKTPTPFCETRMCYSCCEVTGRLETFLKSSIGRQHILQLLLSGDLARAIVDMDNIAFGEGQGPETLKQTTAWAELLLVAEQVVGKKADSTNHRHYRESQERAEKR